MKFYRFILKVRHDKGVVRIHILDTSYESAKQIVMRAEGCPERAILGAVCVDDRGFELALHAPEQLVRLDIPAPSVMQDREAPPNPYVTGYGKKIPTRYRVRTIDSRWRRVYVMCYSNVGTAYVLHDGVKTIVNLEVP